MNKSALKALLINAEAEGARYIGIREKEQDCLSRKS